MRLRAATSFATAVLAVAAIAGAAPPDAGATCLAWWQESRPTGYGYRHVVVIKNGCKKPATCKVSTDVNPEVQTVAVPAGATVDVVTFLEAPAPAFVPTVSCKLD